MHHSNISLLLKSIELQIPNRSGPCIAVVLLEVFGSRILQPIHKSLFISEGIYKSGNEKRRSGLSDADLHLHLYQFDSENLISNTEEISRQKALCCHMKTHPSVTK
jgi:hypothetical protein